MPTLTQGFQTGEFLLGEHEDISFDQVTVTIAGGVALPSGTVLGRITATGKYVAHNTSLSNGAQVAAAVLYTPLPGVNGDAQAAAVTRLAEVIRSVLNGGTGVLDAAATELAARNIIVR
jgi:hypothetical protein